MLAIQELEKAPQLDDSSAFYWRTFNDLSTTRSLGMGVGPIPITAMFEYANFYGFTQSEAETMIYIVQQVDDCYVRLISKRNEKAGS